ncbi:MAG TPA: CHASE4 domain-containing protein, partial [Opitutus sp.]|nr:CHASE4 domain-containing protein [Opitutus sp.]
MNSAEPSDTEAKRLRFRPAGWSLQKKAWLITVGVLIALAALLTLGIDRVFRQGSDQMEQRWVAESVRRVESALAAEIDALERTARDYATWTDTYEFMTNPASTYIESNLLPATFANLQLDAFLFLELTGTLRSGRVYQKGEVTTKGVEALASALASSARTAATPEGARPVKGFVRVTEGIAMFALVPVHRDDGSGVSPGALAHVRFLNEERVRRLREVVNLDLVLREEAALDPGIVRGEKLTTGFLSNAIDDRQMSVWVPLNDAQGRALAWWELTLPRDIHLQGVQGRVIFYSVMGVLILAAAILIGWMLRVMVISRLEALHRAVKHVGATSDLSMRLSLKGGDELTSVGEEINRMLETLEQGEVSRVAAEQERERLNKELQEAQKLEAIGTLTGGLAHDFNNLLTIVRGSMTLLRLDCPANFVGEEHLKRIENATSQATGLVRQMMAFGRRVPTVFTQLHLSAVVRDALHLVRARVPKAIEFRFLNEAANDLVYADATQLQQMLVNLVTNSMNAMPDGVGQMTVKISEVRLPDPARPETSSVACGDYLRLTVSDTGCGIPPDVLLRIFEPFYTTKGVRSGTGLGLPVVHGIITQHDGTIGVESSTGLGTTVFVHLPRIADRNSAGGRRAIRMNGSGDSNHAGNVLLVDDDVLVRETLEAGLRNRKYRITCATSGAQALKLVREQRGVFDAVVTDQMMPGMTGIELGEILARENPALPLILVTGFASALDEAKIKALGFSAMLMKPVTIDELDNAVRLAQQRDRM